MRKVVWALVVLGVAGCSAAGDPETTRRTTVNAGAGAGGSSGGAAGANQTGGSSGAAGNGSGGSGAGVNAPGGSGGAGVQTGGAGGSGAGASGSGGTFGGGGAGAAAGAGTGGAAGNGATLPGGVHELDVGPFTLPGGSEETFCIDVPLSQDGKGFDVSHFEGQITTGGHHMILYNNKAVTAASTAPYKCSVFGSLALFSGPNGMTPLFPSQQKETVLDLPAGIAYHFPDNAFVTIDFHYLNTTSGDVTASGKILMTEPAPGTVTQHSNIFFMGPVISLTIPPGMFTYTHFYNFNQTNPISIFGATTHSHKWTVETDLAFGMENSTQPAYTNTNWDEPPLQMYAPAISVPGNGGGMQLTCSYNNTTSSNLVFGESAATNEMCITWGYYYPDNGALLQLGN